MAEVEAFLWRSKQFPELLFVLVEPNHLGFEGKTLVANWLADTSDRSASNQSAVVVILTAPWHLPSSVQQLKLKPDKSVVKKWKKESTTEPHLQLRECWMRVRVTSEVCLCLWNVLSFFARLSQICVHEEHGYMSVEKIARLREPCGRQDVITPQDS